MSQKVKLTFIILIFCPIISKAQINKKISPETNYLWQTQKSGPVILRQPLELKFLELNQNMFPVSVKMSNTLFNKVYLLNDKGNTVSSGFINSSFFRPTDNNLVFGNSDFLHRDAFNPYGTRDIRENLLYGAINTLISNFKKK